MNTSIRTIVLGRDWVEIMYGCKTDSWKPFKAEKQELNK